jgi:hypothetical protein
MFTLPVSLFWSMFVTAALLILCSFVAIGAVSETERRAGILVAGLFVVMACFASYTAGFLRGVGTPLNSRLAAVRSYDVLSVAEIDSGYVILAIFKDRPVLISVSQERVIERIATDETQDQRLEPLGINEWRLVYKSPMNTSLVLELRDKPQPSSP